MLILLIALFAWPKINNPNKGLLARLESAGLGCLNGHSNALQHFHPRLIITIDGSAEAIPANFGISSGCMGEIHTHDATGTLHVETLFADKAVYLKDFFTVWDKTIERDGYAVSMTVDGKPSYELGNLLLKDKQQIVLEYKKTSD